jgi:hypothetical protein
MACSRMLPGFTACNEQHGTCRTAQPLGETAACRPVFGKEPCSHEAYTGTAYQTQHIHGMLVPCTVADYTSNLGKSCVTALTVTITTNCM